MKKYIILPLLLASMATFAQKFSVRPANNLFEKRAYLDAAELYKQSNINDMESMKRIGDSYYFNIQMDKAAKWYDVLFSSYGDNVDYQYMFRYAQALKGIRDYEKENEWTSKHRKALEQDLEAQKTLEYMAQVDADVPYISEPNKAGINTENSDFGVVFFGDKVIYSSASDSISSKVYKWNKQPYLDLFVANVDTDGNISDPVLLSDEINTGTHEAAVAITKDGKTLYFSRTNKKKVKLPEEKVATIELMKTEFVEGKWTNVTELPFNDDSYSCGQPTLSVGEKKLYFVSDMPGTIGMMDIFEVAINDDGSFGTPKNLENTINTEKREMFPYMSEYNTLYFS